MKFIPQREEAGLRLDVWLTGRLADLSRARVQSLIRDGHVKVDGAQVSAHSRVTAGCEVLVEIPDPQVTALVPEDIPLDVVFEDSDLIVVNKAAGMVVHPAAGHPSGTLVNALLFHCGDLAGVGGELRPGIVHRLDRDTTGVIVAAKTQLAMDSLARQFKDREVEKRYAAVVHGVPDPKEGSLATEIGRSRHDRKKMSVTTCVGRDAVTHYAVTQVMAASSLVQVRIETGRTHQIRVHMAHIGHPVVGDPQYGSRKRDAVLPVEPGRQLLHAESLSILHPATGEPMTFRAEFPCDLAGAVVALGGRLDINAGIADNRDNTEGSFG